MTEKHQCSEKVWFQYGSHLCEIPAIVERDGKWYCKIHDPAQIKALPELIEALRAWMVFAESNYSGDGMDAVKLTREVFNKVGDK